MFIKESKLSCVTTRSKSPYTTRFFHPACRAPGFRFAHLHAAHAHGDHLTDSFAATRYTLRATRYAPIWSRDLLLRTRAQALATNTALMPRPDCGVSAFSHPKTGVLGLIAAAHPNCNDHFLLPIAKDLLWTHGQRMVTHNYTLLNNH